MMTLKEKVTQSTVMDIKEVNIVYHTFRVSQLFLFNKTFIAFPIYQNKKYFINHAQVSNK